MFWATVETWRWIWPPPSKWSRSLLFIQMLIISEGEHNSYLFVIFVWQSSVSEEQTNLKHHFESESKGVRCHMVKAKIEKIRELAEEEKRKKQKCSGVIISVTDNRRRVVLFSCDSLQRRVRDIINRTIYILIWGAQQRDAPLKYFSHRLLCVWNDCDIWFDLLVWLNGLLCPRWTEEFQSDCSLQECPQFFFFKSSCEN